MRFQPSRLALMAAALLTLSTTAVAVAQNGPPPPAAPPMADGHGGPSSMTRHHHRRPDPEARAQHLRDVLQLRSDQDGALKAYLEAAGPREWKKDGPRRQAVDGPRKPLTTPERLDRETEHLNRAKVRIDATRAFYDALSPSQRKAFDALGPMGGGHGPKMRRAEFRHLKGGPDGMPARPPKAD